MMLSALARGPRYVGVAAVCIAVNNALLIALDAAGIYYGLSVILSAIVMIPLSYSLQLRLTFRGEPSWPAFGRYAAVMLVNTPLAWLLLWLIHDKGSLPMVWAAPIITFILFIWNYVASGWAILARRTKA
jgi:putative flippase GtrA